MHHLRGLAVDCHDEVTRGNLCRHRRKLSPAGVGVTATKARKQNDPKLRRTLGKDSFLPAM